MPCGRAELGVIFGFSSGILGNWTEGWVGSAAVLGVAGATAGGICAGITGELGTIVGTDCGKGAVNCCVTVLAGADD